jgi:hypothetical protein
MEVGGGQRYFSCRIAYDLTMYTARRLVSAEFLTTLIHLQREFRAL